MSAHANILGTGTALPGPAIDNVTLSQRFGANAQWIDLFVGTRTRHFAVDIETGARTSTLSALATSAASAAMADAGVDAGEIDFIVLGTATPDHLMPTSVNLVADELGIDQVPTYQLQSGCAGAIAALDVAMARLSPQSPTGLVIGADVCVKHLRLDRDANSKMSPAELVNYVLFGDGAGAVVVSYDDAGARMRLSHVINRFTGRGRAPGQQIEWFGIADRDSDIMALNEDYKAIEALVPDMAAEVVAELLRTTGWDRDSIDYLMPPQLSGRMTDKIVRQLDVASAKDISVVASTGNNGNALPFLQLDALAGLIGPGERAVLAAIESSKWIKGGFVVEGLS
ncbi:3-oxoacyl-ACP synthase III family protein [Nocardia sp. NPDC058705]|uniref:3-oxoacyl-ACP synthase III family protein n=1 Tax=Nocardia sp. NPDC058705 TaxID=3346609 RepID=UPI0036AD7876